MSYLTEDENNANFVKATELAYNLIQGAKKAADKEVWDALWEGLGKTAENAREIVLGQMRAQNN